MWYCCVVFRLGNVNFALQFYGIFVKMFNVLFSLMKYLYSEDHSTKTMEQFCLFFFCSKNYGILPCLQSPSFTSCSTWPLLNKITETKNKIIVELRYPTPVKALLICLCTHQDRLIGIVIRMSDCYPRGQGF